MNQISRLLGSCLLLATSGMQAQVSLPSIFANHMVLQQKSEVPVWGWGTASSTIRVVGSWAPKDTVTAVVGSDGHWKTALKTDGAGGPYTLTVMGGGKKVFNDVMLGEVWLCSGQSNMEWTPSHSLINAQEEIAAANHPNIRFFHIPKRGANDPQNNCDATWAVCTPEVMKQTSSIAYFFGRNLKDSLNVPVGLIVSAWGGTPAEVWLPKEDAMSNEAIRSVVPTKTYPWWPIESGVLYNQMIHPIIPYALAGSIWYQGESNQDHASSYAVLLKTMIERWRKNFGKEFPFYIVQIAPHTYKSVDNGPARIREAEEWVSRNVAQSGLVVISDLVEDVANIHPIDKQHVGLRLANMALGNSYGKLVTGYASPLFEGMTTEKNKAIVSFIHAEKGLVCKGKQIEGVQIAGEDGAFVAARAQIKGNQLIVSSPEVKNPQAVRYCFDDATIGNLFSKEGLPVAPFRSDRNWTKQE